MKEFGGNNSVALSETQAHKIYDLKEIKEMLLAEREREALSKAIEVKIGNGYDKKSNRL